MALTPASASLFSNPYTQPLRARTLDNTGAQTTDNRTDNKTDTKPAPTPAATPQTKPAPQKPSAGGAGSLGMTLTDVLKEMGLNANDPVTFRSIMGFRDQLTKVFEAQVKADLKELGIDENVNFQIVSGASGGLKVISDHADKAKIEQYFKDNPERVKQFEKIQALNTIEETRKNQSLDVNAIRQRIQIESMTTWFASTGQNPSSIMNFSGGETAFFSGINRRV